MSATVSNVDVDGIIVIGKLPLVTHLDKGSLDVSNFKLLPIINQIIIPRNKKINIGTNQSSTLGLVEDFHSTLLQICLQKNSNLFSFGSSWSLPSNKLAL